MSKSAACAWTGRGVRRSGGARAEAAALLFGAAVLTGCVSSSVPPFAANVPNRVPPPRSAPTAEAAGNGLYVLQPGDAVAVTFFFYPRFDATVKIRPDGHISLAPVDEVRAAGLTAPELDAILTSMAAKWIDNPELSVTVTDYAARKKVYIGGEVIRGGLHPLEQNMTALEALVQAGGVLKTGNLKNVIIIRKDPNGGRMTFSVDLDTDLKSGAVTNDVALNAFDVVFVPKTRIAEVNQFVNQYIEQLIPIDFVASMGFSYVKSPDISKDSTSTVTFGVAP